MTERTVRATTEAVKESVQLMAPRTWGAEPVKSAVRESPSTVKVTFKGTGGAAHAVALSMWSVKE